MIDEISLRYNDGLTERLIGYEATIASSGIVVDGKWSVKGSLANGECRFSMGGDWDRWLELESLLASLSKEHYGRYGITDLPCLFVSVRRGQQSYCRTFYGLGFGLARDRETELDYLRRFVIQVRAKIEAISERPIVRKCPTCQSERVEEIQYDTADLETVDDDSKLFRCQSCTSEFGKLPEFYLSRARETQRRKQEVFELGILDANVNKSGFITCPCCSVTFLITHSGSWDGQTHRSCGVRLKPILPPGGIQPRWFH